MIHFRTVDVTLSREQRDVQKRRANLGKRTINKEPDESFKWGHSVSSLNKEDDVWNVNHPDRYKH